MGTESSRSLKVQEFKKFKGSRVQGVGAKIRSFFSLISLENVYKE